ncbi:MAG: zinc-ribbon domain-containing protein [Clostridia bacterium]|nr:zinc-ribbon domain-containing protein [Clostridia bacterium]
MKFCKSCGANLEDKALFCTKCGASMKEEVKQEADPVQLPDDPMSAPTTILTHNPLAERAEALKTQYSAPNNVYTENKAAVMTAAPVKAVKKEKKQPSGIGIKLLSIFLSFVFCVVLLTTSSLGIIRGTFDPDSIKASISSIEIEDIEEITIEDENGRDVPLSKYILDFCDEEVKKKYDLDEDKVVEVLKDTKADEFLGEVIADYSAYLVNGEELRELDADRVITWIRENEDTIEEVVEYEFKEADYEELEAELRRSDVIRSLSEESLEDELDMDLTLMHRGLSLWAYITLIVLVCAIAGLVAAINRKKLRAVFTYVTVSVAIVGGVFLVTSGAAYAALSLILPETDLASSLGVPFELIRSVIDPFMLPILIRGAVMFGVGFIASMIYKIVSDRRRAKA